MDYENKTIVTLESEEVMLNNEDLGVGHANSDSEVIAAISPVIEERTGMDMSDEYEDGYWTVKRVTSSGNMYIFPKSPAGN